MEQEWKIFSAGSGLYQAAASLCSGIEEYSRSGGWIESGGQELFGGILPADRNRRFGV